MRQFVDHQLPLAAREFFHRPAGAHLQAATADGIGGGDVLRAGDELASGGEVGSGHQRQGVGEFEAGIFEQGDAGAGHLAQVVGRNLGGHAHGDAAGAVEQHERQPRGQQPGLGGRAVIVGNEVGGARIDLAEQQPGDGREPRLGVAHGGGAVAVARAEVALTVDQRIALREVLRQPHQGVVGGLVAMRVKAAEHVAHHPRRLDRLGIGGQSHAPHGVENAPLHRLQTVAHIGQGAALDHGNGVVEIGAAGIVAQRQRVGVVFRPVVEFEGGLFTHIRCPLRSGRRIPPSARGAPGLHLCP